MKYLRSFLIAIICSLAAFQPARAQLAGCTPKEAQAVKASMVFVVLKKETDDVAKIYNLLIKSAVEKYWTFSKYGFVGIDTIDRVIMNKGLYFMTTFDEQIVSNNGFINVSSIGIIRGGKLFGSYKHSEEMAWVYVRKDLWDYSARFTSMIQMLQNAMVWKSEPVNKKKDIYASFNKAGLLKGMVLYLDKKDLNEKLVDMSKLEKVYKHPVKVVDADEIKKAIDEQDPKVAFMHLTNNRNASCFFVAAKGGKVLWENEASINTQLQLINLTILEQLNAEIDIANNVK